MSDVERAVGLFRDGCVCSQAVLGVYGPRYGLDEGCAMRLAAGFAGGMRVADTCGAVTGALMVVGLAYCGADCRRSEGREAAYGAVTSFAKEFRRRQGSLICRELLGCDISTPEGAKLATEQDLFRTKCVELVREASEIVEGLLAEAK